LLIEEVCVARVLAEEEPLKVLMDKPASWRPAEPSGIPDGAIRRFKLNKERAQHVDAPGSARGTILFPLRAWGRYFRVYEPVTTLDVVIVSA